MVLTLILKLGEGKDIDEEGKDSIGDSGTVKEVIHIG